MFSQTLFYSYRRTLPAWASIALMVACGGGSGGGTEVKTPQITAAQRLAADDTFGNKGSITVPLGATNGAIVGARWQSDGKLLVAGWRQTGLLPGGGVGQVPREILVWRLNPDGALDTSFGVGGMASLSFEGSDRLSDLALQSDGRIILASASTEPCTNAGFGPPPGQFVCANANGVLVTPKTVLARLTNVGVLDPSFGERGRVNLIIGSTWNWAPQITVQADQKVLVLTQENYPTARISNWRLLRLAPDGATDPTFNQGMTVTSRCGVSGSALAVTLDGRILVAGMENVSYADPTANPGACVEALQANGQADASFNAGQPVRVLAQNNIQLNALRVLDDGRSVLTGKGNNASGDFFFAHRLTASGAPDNSFGAAGTARSALANNRYGMSSATIAAPDGTVVLAGYTYSVNSTESQPIWMRWTTTGRPDEAFGSSGVYSPSGSDAPVVLVRDASGRWLSVQLTKAADSQLSFIVSRMKGDTAMP